MVADCPWLCCYMLPVLVALCFNEHFILCCFSSNLSLKLQNWPWKKPRGKLRIIVVWTGSCYSLLFPLSRPCLCNLFYLCTRVFFYCRSCWDVESCRRLPLSSAALIWSLLRHSCSCVRKRCVIVTRQMVKTVTVRSCWSSLAVVTHMGYFFMAGKRKASAVS